MDDSKLRNAFPISMWGRVSKKKYLLDQKAGSNKIVVDGNCTDTMFICRCSICCKYNLPIQTAQIIRKQEKL